MPNPNRGPIGQALQNDTCASKPLGRRLPLWLALSSILSIQLLACNGEGQGGATGEAGPQGTSGSMGERGPAGPPGPEGMQGVQGNAGSEGPAGPTGAEGPAGAGFNWRGEWAQATAYAPGDVIRSASGTRLYIATAASTDVAPSADTPEWAVMLTSESLTHRECPEGMNLMPNKVCVDRVPRLQPIENVAEFNAFVAHGLCREQGTRLCDASDVNHRSACIWGRDYCDDLNWRGSNSPHYFTTCLPVMLAPSQLETLEGNGSQLKRELLNFEAYYDVGASHIGGIPSILGFISHRSDCEEHWNREGVAEYLCCLD